MKKGMTYFFGFIANPEERVKLIADTGFDCVMLNADPRFDYQNGPFKKQIKLFKKYGVGFDSLHFRYKTSELPEFWKDNKIGKRMARDLVKDVKLASKYGFSCVVVHLIGEVNKIGFDRLDKTLKLCEKLNVPLAFENIDDNTALLATLEHYKDNPYAKFCYDAGHHNLYDTKFDFLKEYGDRLACFHLHDNAGWVKDPKPGRNGVIDPDQHTLNKYGSINWDNFAKKIANLKNIPPLNYEMLYKADYNDTMEEVVKETYKQAVELETMVNKYRKVSKN